MRANLLKLSVVGLVIVFITLGHWGTSSSLLAAQATMSATIAATGTVFATGLNNPRGLTFGPDGFLYVAEGGEGGTTQTTSQDCTQVTGIGPYSGGMTARISKVAPDGTRTTIVDGLPSSQSSAATGNQISGVASLAFIDKTLYALIGGAGCSHGLKGTNNGVIQVNADNSTTQIANLSAFYKTNPTKDDGGQPDGDPYNMVEAFGKLYVVNPNDGDLEVVTTDGKINRLIDLSASQGHAVPTTILFHDGDFYVSNLVGGAKVFKITPDGQMTILSPKLTAVLGLAFDQQGQMYALETSAKDNSFTTPGTGTIVRLKLDSEATEVIATGLTFPTAMTFGPDGMLYVSNFGYLAKPGIGQIVRFEVSPAK